MTESTVSAWLCRAGKSAVIRHVDKTPGAARGWYTCTCCEGGRPKFPLVKAREER